MDPLNPYELLRVRPDATSADIRAAYRRLALYYHPGRKLGCAVLKSDELQYRFHVFTLLAASLETLLDPKFRRKFDEEYGTLAILKAVKRNVHVAQGHSFEIPQFSFTLSGKRQSTTVSCDDDFLERLGRVRQGLPLPDPFDIFYREFKCHLGGIKRTISFERKYAKSMKLVPNEPSSTWTDYTQSPDGLVVTTKRMFPHRILTRTETRRETGGNTCRRIQIEGEETFTIQKGLVSDDKDWCNVLNTCSSRWNICGECVP
jgi:hypothetical protein